MVWTSTLFAALIGLMFFASLVSAFFALRREKRDY